MVEIKNMKVFFRKNLFVILVGFVLGLLPAFLYLIRLDTLLSVWSIVPALIACFIALFVKWLIKIKKYVGIILLIIILVVYLWISTVLLYVTYFGGPWIG